MSEQTEHTPEQLKLDAIADLATDIRCALRDNPNDPKMLAYASECASNIFRLCGGIALETLYNLPHAR